MTTFLRDARAATPTAEPTRPVPAGHVRSATVDVLFPLLDEDDWPPYPAEMLEADLLSHDLAEITGVPWFVTGISRGDIVSVDHDGHGFVAGPVVSRGGHSTVHMMAGTQQELAPIAAALRAAGAGTRSGLQPPMLTVDIPETCSLPAVLAILDAAESATCAYTVACRQHGRAGERSSRRQSV